MKLLLIRCFSLLDYLQRSNRESWFPESYNRCLENFLQAFVPQIISRLKDHPQIAKVLFLTILSLSLSLSSFRWYPLHWSNFNWVSKVTRDCFGFTQLNIAPWLAQKTRHTIFSTNPMQKQFVSYHFEFSLANDNVNLSSDWSLGLLWFYFLDTQLNCCTCRQR